MKTLIKWIIGIAIGVAFIWLSIRHWPAGKILEGGIHLSGSRLYSKNWSLNLWYVLFYFLTLVSMHIFRTWRWQPLLAPVKKLDFWRLNRYCAVGFLMVFILPLRLGELVRPYLAASEKENGIPMSTALASIFLERTMDGLMVGLLLSIILFFTHPEGPYKDLAESIRMGSYITLAVFASAVGVLALIYVYQERAAMAAYAVLSKISESIALKVKGIIERFIKGLSMIPNFRYLFMFILLSAGYWFSNGFGLYVLARGFNIHIPLIAGFAMMSTVVVGMLIPNSPANIGSFWYFLVLPLPLYGIANNDPKVIVYSLSVWLIQLIQLSLFGLYFIVTGKVHFDKGLPDLEELAEQGTVP